MVVCGQRLRVRARSWAGQGEAKCGCENGRDADCRGRECDPHSFGPRRVTLDSAAREGRGESWYVYWKAHEEEQRLRSDVPIFSASSTYANATLWDGTSAIDANLTLTDASNIVLLYCSGGFSPPPHSTIPATQATG